MSKEKELIPAFRFPEFVNEGEWDVTTLGEILIKNSTKNRELKYSLVQSVSNKHGFINQDEYFDNRIIASKDTSNYYVIDKGVFAYNPSRIDVGSLAYKQDNNISIISPLYVSFRAKQEKAVDLFLLNWFFSEQFRKQMIFEGGVRNTLNYENLQEIEIVFPSITEQQKIASCLSSLDELITAHSQKLELLKSHKKGLMQNLFPQPGESSPNYRFPVFNGLLNKVGFADLGDIKIGLTHKPDYISSGVPFLSSKNISNGFIDFKDVQYISQEKFESMPQSTKPQIGDILFTRVGSNLGNPIILEQEIEFGIFVSLGFFRVNKNAHNYYIKYWMESDLFWKQVNQKVGGGAKDNLNSTWLREFELYIPSIPEQQKIASCLSAVDALITAQAKKIEQLQLHKKGLMQGLFPETNN